jgi:ABC transporter
MMRRSRSAAFPRTLSAAWYAGPTTCAPRRPRPPRHRTWTAGSAQLLEAWRGSGGRTAWPGSASPSPHRAAGSHSRRRGCRSRSARSRSSPTSTSPSTGAPGWSSSVSPVPARPPCCASATTPRSTKPLRHHAERAGERAGGPGPPGGGGATGAGLGPFSGDSVDKPAAVLSGGEKTRLALATLVVSSANVLLLDEPTNSFDPASREEVLAALRSYAGRSPRDARRRGGGGPLARAGPAATGRRGGPLGS